MGSILTINHSTALMTSHNTEGPVLVRGGLVGGQWDRVRASWTRSQLNTLFGDAQLTRVVIPYGDEFGSPGNATTLGQQLQYMEWLHSVQAAEGSRAGDAGGGEGGAGAGANEMPPGYIFQTIGDTDKAEWSFALPEFLDPTRTEIVISNPQVYVGFGAHFGAKRCCIRRVCWDSRCCLGLSPPYR
jgi:hypothetical protein